MKKIFLPVFVCLWAACSYASIIYNDATGDLDPGVAGGDGTVDIVRVEVSHTDTDLIFALTVDGNLSLSDWARFMIGIATGGSGTTSGNGWGRPINLDSPIGGMDFWVGSWVESGGGTTLDYYSSGWNAGSVPGYSLIPGSQSLLTITLSRAALGLSGGDTFYFDVYSSGGLDTDSAYDALANANVTITAWDQSYTSRENDTGLLSYTIVNPTCVVTPSNGPLAGGNIVLVTNAAPGIGNGSDITSISVGGVSTTNITGQGTNWVRFIAPAVGSAGGLKDIVIQSTSIGANAMDGAYTYNPAGRIIDSGTYPDWSRWGEVVGMPGPMRSMAAAAMNGSIYVGGGQTALILTNVYRYNGTNWIEVAGLPALRRNVAFALLNGTLYSIGGQSGVSVNANVYAFNGTSWSSSVSLPTARTRLGAGTLNGNIYAVGGSTSRTSGSEMQSNVYAFDGTSWAEVAGLPMALEGMAVEVLNGYLYSIGGGANGVTNVFRFDGTGWTEVAGLPEPRSYMGSAVMDGKIYVVGGLNSWARTNVYVFDGTIWTETAGLPEARRDLSACALNGHIYAIGGASSVTATNTVFECPTVETLQGVNPSSGSWTGGYPVMIVGTNLGNGTDITNVTLCGVTATISSQTTERVWVQAGVSANGLIGDVVVQSVSFGTTVKTNGFTYMASGIEVSGAGFAAALVGRAVTNIFTLTNSGNEALLINAATNNGTGAAYFNIAAIPSRVEPGTVSNFPVVFTPGAVGAFAPTCHIVNSSPMGSYSFGLSGSGFAASTTAGPFVGGNAVTFTNGNFGTITNVLVGGVEAVIVDSGTSWFTVVMPSAGAAGTADVVVQTSDNGDITLAGAYAYNPAGEIGWTETHIAWTNLGSGMNNWVESLLHDGTTLYVGGLFTNAGGTAARTIAQWNGTNWLSLGSGLSGMNPRTTDLAHDGTYLYAAGSFTNAGGLAANRVARWNGSSWSALSTGVGAPGYSDLVWDVLLAGGNLYAAGRFTNAGATAVMNIAMWNGSSWSPLGDGLGLAATIDDSYDVRALAHDGTNLYAGGEFTTSGGLTVNRVAMWNGTTWTNLGSGLDNEVWALLHDGRNLYAAGGFHTAGGVTAHRIAMWNGSTWTNLGSGMDYAVEALAHDGTNLYAGGSFTTAGGVAASLVAKWDGANWSPLGSGMTGSMVRDLHFHGADLYAGGWFTAAGGVPAANIAQWKTTITTNEGVSPASGSWTGGYEVVLTGSHLGDGTDITNVTLCGRSATILSQSATQVVVRAAAAVTPGLGDVRVFSTSHGETVKNNAFTYTGAGILVSGPAFGPLPLGASATNMYSVANTGTEALTIAAATNSGTGAEMFDVSALAGLTVAPGTASNVPVVFTASAIGTFSPECYPANNSPVAGYSFGLTGSVFHLSANSGPQSGGNTITISNGYFGAITNVLVGSTSVSPMSSGANWFTIVIPAAVGAGTVDIVVQTSDNGEFTLAGAYTYNPPGQIGWTTGMTIWTNLGSGVNNSPTALFADGENVYAGGTFTTAGGQSANRVAKWNGTSWTNLGSGVDNNVYGLSGDGTNLYVVGSFGSAGGVPAAYVAMWNGVNWTNLGSGLIGGTAQGVLCAGSTVYVAGGFTNAGGSAASRVAAWDGASWTNLGAGILNGSVSCLAHDGTNLYVGGQFTNAGGVAAMNVARWNGASWTNLGAGIGDRWASVRKLDFIGNTLYACGLFDAGAGRARVAKWDGASWTGVGGGVGGDAYAMAQDGTNLYVGGNFTSPGSRVAKWNGTAWSGLDSGANNLVWALAHDGTTLYAGGAFDSAGGVSVNRIAMWTPTVATNPGVAPVAGSYTGGYEVVIRGSYLGSGSDIMNVTLCGVEASIQSQNATQVVVRAGAAAMPIVGDVCVISASQGTTVKSNGFEYLRAAQAALTFAPADTQAYLTTNALSVSGGSGTGAVSYSVTSGPGMIVGDTNLVATAGSGTIVVVAAKAQDDFYFETSTTSSVTAVKANQTIALSAIPDQVTTNSVVLAATASSWLDVSFSVLSGPASISDGTNLSFSGAGSVSIVASQTGDENYNAVSVTNSFIVTKAVASVTLTNLTQTYNGTARTVTASTVPDGLAVDITYNGSGTAPTAAGSYIVTGVVNDVMYQGWQTGTLDVARASQEALSFIPPTPQTYNTTNGLSASGGQSSGSWSFTVLSGTAEIVGGTNLWMKTGTGEVSVRATKAGDVNWNAASVTGTVTAGKANQSIVFPAIADQLITNCHMLAAIASSGLEVSFSVSSGPASIADGTNLTFNGAGAVSIVASQAGDDNWNAAPDMTNTFNVSKIVAQVSFDNLSQTYDGTAREVTATTTPVGLLVEFTYDGSAAAPTNVGDYVVVGTVKEALYDGAATGVLVVVQGEQTIDFAQIPRQRVTNIVHLVATASSGLPVSFELVEGRAVLADGTNLSFTGAGAVTVRAMQAGDANWKAAADVLNTFRVGSGLSWTDYDGDGASDMAVVNEVSGDWYVRTLGGSVLLWKQNWGYQGVVAVPGDYNGDGVADLTVFDNISGNWFIYSMGADEVPAWYLNWGHAGTMAMPGDYDGDGVCDLTVYNPNTGNWHISTPAGEVLAWYLKWGYAGATAVPGDYDGDAVCDLAVYNDATGNWNIGTLKGDVLAWDQNWGYLGATAVPGDYDGDGTSDMAIYDHRSGSWYIRTMDDEVLMWGENWGYPGAVAIPGDYDGDGLSDLAVYDQVSGRWYIRTMGGKVHAWGVNWGGPGLKPVGLSPLP